MSQQKRPEQGDGTNWHDYNRRAVELIMRGPAAYTDLDNIQNMQNPFRSAPEFDASYRSDNPGMNWDIISYNMNGAKFWVTVDRGVTKVGPGVVVTRDQQIKQQNWQREIGEIAASDQWPIIEDGLRNEDGGNRWWRDPVYLAWFQATRDMIFPPNTSALASNSNNSTTAHSGGGTYSMSGGQYSSGAQYSGGESSKSGGTYSAGGAQYTGGAQYSGGESSNSGGTYSAGGAQYPGDAQYSDGTSYHTGESAPTSTYFDPTTDTTEDGRPRENRSSGTSGRGAGNTGHSSRHSHR
ncbi:hypothetical protein BOTCAL_0285g00170 [Botryotinia calthae]|uniref:Uncharacterized protein n=1 Tax=Botryotinia calthae TaxID=38488 RepID=A0A4Y8CV25_9HELO|nr:hypothetical protein BOTCAL_0285g00170 [Botryotinia calthae]